MSTASPTAAKSDRQLLKEALTEMKYPYQRWGIDGASKPFKRFVKAWKNAEILWDHEQHSDTLEVDAAVIKVIWEINGRTFELREKHRDHTNGYREKRDEFDGSVAGALKHGETAYAAAIRELGEELGQTKKAFKDPSKFTLHPDGRMSLGPMPCKTYPPFQIIYHRRLFICKIDEHLYAEEYICIEPDKTTYFGWKEIESAKN
jgi:8-oxo-dGTP pyrophosphatase MutT (NUDIX family)